MSLVLVIIALLICEVVIAVIFSALAQWVYKRIGLDPKSILKGTMERLFLVVCLSSGYPHGLTLFGALKLGTRLKQDDQGDEKAFNDFYLLGNLLSVTIALAYVIALKHLDLSASLPVFR
jgi:hypothetical protein